MKDRIFYTTGFGFVFGALLRSFIFVNFYFAMLIGVLASVSILLFGFISQNRWGVTVSVFVLTFSLGILRFHVADKSAPEVFESQFGQKVSFSGKIADEPDIRENNQKLTIEAQSGGEKNKILLSLSLDQS